MVFSSRQGGYYGSHTSWNAYIDVSQGEWRAFHDFFSILYLTFSRLFVRLSGDLGCIGFGLLVILVIGIVEFFADKIRIVLKVTTNTGTPFKSWFDMQMAF